MNQPLLSIKGLKTYFHTFDGVVKAVDDVSFDLAPGEILGVVGESGSGKSVTSMSVMRLLPKETAFHPSGKVAFAGKDLLHVGDAEMADLRGSDLAMIFQEPMTSLNPVLTVGEQVAEAILRHESVTPADAQKRTITLFEEVGLPDPAERFHMYPHEMSGGQKQRVMIAMALSCNPKLLIADEPTTALDVTIQKQILELLLKLRDDRGMAILFITHDLGVVGEVADKVAVMYRGHLLEYGDVLSIFENPSHPYTKGLLACRPSVNTGLTLLPTVDDFMTTTTLEDGTVNIEEKTLSPQRLEALRAPRPSVDENAEVLLTVEDLTVTFPTKRNLLGRTVQWFTAVDKINFEIRKGQTVGLVGESGCGKTTTGRAILRLVDPAGGRVRFRGTDLSILSTAPTSPESLELRRKLQIIFQDPYSSLNPRQSIEAILTEPMAVHGIGSSQEERSALAGDLLDEVGLGAQHLRRFPHEFSGGQRQRIGIARALAVNPELIICDESVSALDVSVQAQVLNLLRKLQQERGLSYLFISHDLSVVRFLSDIICVMKDGQLVEKGEAKALYDAPKEAYTQDLLSAIPDGSVPAIKARLSAASQA